MDEHLLLMAEHNGGYLHRTDVLDNAGTDRQIRGLVRAGLIRRIRVGTYAPSVTWDALDPTGRHVVLARSVVDKFPLGAVALSHHSALACHGVALHGVDLSTVHVVRLDAGGGRKESGVVHHRAEPGPESVALVDDRLCVDAARAVWELASISSRRTGLVSMDSAVNLAMATKEQIIAEGEQCRRWPGSRVARMTARLIDGGAESPGETLARLVCLDARLPRPQTQVEIRDADGAFVARNDLGWIELCHVGEFDGFRKYLRDLRSGEDPSGVLVREKLREDRLRSLGYGVSRMVWSEVQEDASVATGRRLAHELAVSADRLTRGRRHIV